MNFQQFDGPTPPDHLRPGLGKAGKKALREWITTERQKLKERKAELDRIAASLR